MSQLTKMIELGEDWIRRHGAKDPRGAEKMRRVVEKLEEARGLNAEIAAHQGALTGEYGLEASENISRATAGI